MAKMMISAHFELEILDRLDKLAYLMTGKKGRRVTRAELLGRGAMMVLEDLEPYFVPGPDGKVKGDDAEVVQV